MSLVLGVHCTVSVIRWKTIELTKCDTHFVARPEQNKKTVKNLYSYVFVLFFCLLTLFLCLQFRRLQFLVCTLSTFHSYVLSTSTWDVCPANCKRVAVHTAYSCVSANMLKLCNYSFAPLSLSLSPPLRFWLFTSIAIMLSNWLESSKNACIMRMWQKLNSTSCRFAFSPSIPVYLH